MNQHQQQQQQQQQQYSRFPKPYIDENECNGPRPPVPGQESNQMSKMTETHHLPDFNRPSPPSYIKWHQTLICLLEDREGLDIFKRYVESEGGIHADRLKFYLCCEGLKQQPNNEKAKESIGAIYRFLRKSQLSIPDELRRTIKAIQKNESRIDRNIYDQMQQDIVRIMNETTYPNFLQSEQYVQHVDRIMSANNNAQAISSTASSSDSCSAIMPRSSALPTLHEDTELSINEDMVTFATGAQTPASDIPMRLTRDLLLATQKRRLEVRPPGTHGFSVYSASYSSSYNPVSRQDSERQSCSSGGGGKSDSDAISITNSRDGQPYGRKYSAEGNAMQQSALMNKEMNPGLIPRTQRQAGYVYKTEEFLSKLIPKLEAVRREQENEDKFTRRLQKDQMGSDGGGAGSAGCSSSRIRSTSQGHHHHGQALADALLKKLPLEDDNDQSILDQHVSRVWSDLTPHRSPGTISPCPIVPRRRAHDSGQDSASSIGGQSMRHSKSMPEHASSSKRLTNKWPSINNDSGISVFSLDASTLKSRDNNSRSRSMGIDSVSSNTAFQLEEARRRLEDEPRRPRRYSQQSTSQQNQMPMPLSATSSSDTIIVVYTYLDEDLPYRSKLPGLQPTLKLFKDYLPKKGHFRFFFKTACEDPDNPVIQEEIVNDDDILPLFEGKVMGLVKPYE